MRFIQPGITAALVGAVLLFGSTMANYELVGARHPNLVFSGMACGLCALFALSKTAKKSSRQEIKRERRAARKAAKKRAKYGSIGFESHRDSLISNTTTSLGDTPGSITGSSSKLQINAEPIGSQYFTYTKEAYLENPKPEATMSKRKALSIALLAGLFTVCWGPFSTYARNGATSELVNSPGLTFLIFTLGEMTALPSIYVICILIEPQPKDFEFTWRHLFWGLVCGVAVGTGYLFFFTATSVDMTEIVVPAAVIVGCNPLVAVLIDIIRGEFAGTTWRTRAMLAFAIVLYFGALVLNALGAE